MSKTRLYPSLISANLLQLGAEIEMVDPLVDGYHIDIMDGHFVPNLTWGGMFVEAIAKISKKQLWIHLMVTNPEWWIDHLVCPEGSLVSIHIESTRDVLGCVKKIKEKKWQASVAINPKTAISQTFPFLDILDQVLIMSVEPGFSGQQFIGSVQEKIEPLVSKQKELCGQLKNDHYFSIGMDGGITVENAGLLAHQGVSDFAVASGIFGHTDRVCAIHNLRRII